FGNGNNGNNQYISDRDGQRATAFFTHDFASEGNPNNLMKFLGKHTFTGLWANEEQETSNRNWRRYVAGPELSDFFNQNYNWYSAQVEYVVYLGPSLMNAPSAAGANIPRIETTQIVPPNYYMNVWDSSWNPVPPIGFGNPWNHEYYYPHQAAYTSTQSENPDNYIGWTTTPISIMDSEANGG